MVVFRSRAPALRLRLLRARIFSSSYISENKLSAAALSPPFAARKSSVTLSTGNSSPFLEHIGLSTSGCPPEFNAGYGNAPVARHLCCTAAYERKTAYAEPYPDGPQAW